MQNFFSFSASKVSADGGGIFLVDQRTRNAERYCKVARLHRYTVFLHVTGVEALSGVVTTGSLRPKVAGKWRKTGIELRPNCCSNRPRVRVTVRWVSCWKSDAMVRSGFVRSEMTSIRMHQTPFGGSMVSNMRPHGCCSIKTASCVT
jgi:hypothetical protein